MIHTQQAIPEGMVVDHLCCNKGCVNPGHMDIVTPQENSQRFTRGVPGWVSVGNKEKYGPRRKLKGTRAY